MYTKIIKTRARNEFEEMLRCEGISKRRFGMIIGVKGSTIEKYIDDPGFIRVSQIEKLAEYLEADATTIFKLINEDYARELRREGKYEESYFNK
tara:strand:+ start:923 stop:1204 length:282 start_codon:yes stop_codon:yes gene_type:complete